MGENVGRKRTEEFKAYFMRMVPNSKMNEDTSITPDNIYQEAHTANREILLEIISKTHLPGSTILGEENVLRFNELAKQGKSVLILSEHVSNLDVPNLYAQFYNHKNPEFKGIFERFIFIAGTKLNENPVVKLFTEMFTRVVVYAIRSLAELKNCEEAKEELELANKINLRSTRKIGELRSKGYMFILYPAGTRYRPWMPETKKGITAVYGYLNSFDYFCCVSINGNNMPPAEHEDMTKEEVLEDVIVLNFGEVQETKPYLKSFNTDMRNITPAETEAKKQVIADDIMTKIEQLHEEGEVYRQKFI